MTAIATVHPAYFDEYRLNVMWQLTSDQAKQFELWVH